MASQSLMERARHLFEAPPNEDVAPEDQIFNPLGVHVGSPVRINNIDYRGLNFDVTCIQQLKNSDSGVSADYTLLAKRNGADVVVMLRVFKDAGVLRAVALNLHDQLDTCPGIVEAVRDPAGLFVITRHDRNNEREEFVRLAGRRHATVADVIELIDRDGNGKVETDETKKFKLSVWDYSRQTAVDGVPMVEYLFVERDDRPTPARFKVWKGFAIRPESVELG